MKQQLKRKRPRRRVDFDSPWKEALERYFKAFLAFFFPEAHADIDWSRGYESLDKELQQVVREAELGRRVVDKLFKVWRKDGSEDWILIHIELQGEAEAEFERRMYVYNYRLFDRYNRIVVSLAVLADERPGWRPDRFGYDLWGCSVAFRFPTVKLLDFAADEAGLEASSNPFAAVVLAHLKTQATSRDPEARRGWKVRLAKGLYERGWGAEDVRQLLRFVDWMMELPPELEEQFHHEIHAFEEEKRMPYVTSFERFAIAKGVRKGREKGLREGLLVGIGLALKLKFGRKGQQLLPEIGQLSDVRKLRAIHRAIETATTPDDVRRLIS